MKDTHHITCPGFLPRRVKNQSGSSLVCPPLPIPGRKDSPVPAFLCLSGGLVGGKWRSQTSSLEAQQRGNDFYCPRDSLSVHNYSHLPFPSHSDVQTCWKGVRKNLLGALEAPTFQAAAVPGIPDVCLSSACLPGRNSITVKVRYNI